MVAILIIACDKSRNSWVTDSEVKVGVCAHTCILQNQITRSVRSPFSSGSPDHVSWCVTWFYLKLFSVNFKANSVICETSSWQYEYFPY